MRPTTFELLFSLSILTLILLFGSQINHRPLLPRPLRVAQLPQPQGPPTTEEEAVDLVHQEAPPTTTTMTIVADLQTQNRDLQTPTPALIARTPTPTLTQSAITSTTPILERVPMTMLLKLMLATLGEMETQGSLDPNKPMQQQEAHL